MKAEFAKEMGVAYATVTRWVQSGYVKSRKRGPLVMIPASEVLRIRDEKASRTSKMPAHWTSLKRKSGVK